MAEETFFFCFFFGKSFRIGTSCAERFSKHTHTVDILNVNVVRNQNHCGTFAINASKMFIIVLDSAIISFIILGVCVCIIPLHSHKKQ